MFDFIKSNTRLLGNAVLGNDDVHTAAADVAYGNITDMYRGFQSNVFEQFQTLENEMFGNSLSGFYGNHGDCSVFHMYRTGNHAFGRSNFVDSVGYSTGACVARNLDVVFVAVVNREMTSMGQFMQIISLIIVLLLI